MYANAAAVPADLGRGCNGPIGLITDAAFYANVSTTSYTRPTEPGPYAQHVPGDLAAAQSDACKIHKE